MVLKRSKNLVNKDKYFNKRYFIFPFICEKCKNEFWFEYGMCPDAKLTLYLPENQKPKDEDDNWTYWYNYSSDFGKTYLKYITPATKFCGICSKDIEYIIEKYPKKDDFTSRLALWLDETPIEDL